MFGLGFQFENKTGRVTEAAGKANFRNLGHAAATIRKTAAASIARSDEPAAAGSPPHTRQGLLPRSIRFAQDKAKEEAVIGPEFSKVGEAGAAHEHGGEFRGEEFPEREFMNPALEENLGRFASEWAGSIGD